MGPKCSRGTGMSTNSRERVQSFLAYVGGDGNSALELDENHCCVVEYGVGFECVITASTSADEVFLQAPLFPLLADDERRLLARLMSWNLDGEITSGCTLALDEDANTVVLCGRHPVLKMEPEEFSSLLANFLSTADQVRERLILAQQSDPDAVILADPLPSTPDVLWV